MVPQVGKTKKASSIAKICIISCVTKVNLVLFYGFVGVLAISDFLYHMVALGWYTFLARNVSPILAKQIESLPKGDKRYRMSRMVEAWKFGSGLDYDDHK